LVSVFDTSKALVIYIDEKGVIFPYEIGFRDLNHFPSIDVKEFSAFIIGETII
jgi:hypothetical protein